MDPQAAIAASKSLADAGLTACLIILVVGLIWALRWAVLRGDAFQAARLEDAKEYGATLAKANELMKELGEVVRDANQARLAERIIRLQKQDATS